MRSTTMVAIGAAAALATAVAPPPASWASGLPPVTVAVHGAAHKVQQAGTMPGALIPGLAAILVGCILLALPDLRRRLVHGSAPRRRRRRRRADW